MPLITVKMDETEQNDMETTILEALFLPWWKILAYIGATALAAIAIRITVKFDANTWLENKRSANAIKESRKRATVCRHVWTLYTHSQYSVCNQCEALIATSTLLLFRNDREVLIAGQVSGMQIIGKEGSILVDSPYGNIRR